VVFSGFLQGIKMTDRSKSLIFRLNDHGQGPEIIRQMFLERGWIEFEDDDQEDEDWNLWWRTYSATYRV
jgi:hypothetical protein